MTTKPESASTHKLALAADLLDDIELSRLPAENLVLKAIRLARLIGDAEVTTWLACELAGFPSDDPVSLKYMGVTGRWTNEEKKLGYWDSLAQLDAYIATNRLQMQQLRVPNIEFSPSSSNPNEFVVGYGGRNVGVATQPINQVLQHLNVLNENISNFSGIRSKVLARLHAFVSRVYYELAFSNLQETIFERQKTRVDVLLASTCGPVLEKVPAVYDRLSEGDPESISQALSTCRRIIDAFADAIFPPSNETVTVGGKELKLTAQHHQNRINVFIHRHCDSESRRSRLRRALSDIYDRVSAGVHGKVSPDEARFLFLQTYMLIGEALSLKQEPQHSFESPETQGD